MKAFTLLVVLIALTTIYSGPALGQDDLPACEVALSDLPNQSSLFFRSANDRIEDLNEIIDAGVEDGDIRGVVFDLIQWATLADLAMNINYADVELPECSEIQSLAGIYEDIISGVYRLGGHMYIAVEMNGSEPSERVLSVLPDRMRELVIDLAVWQVSYEEAAE